MEFSNKSKSTDQREAIKLRQSTCKNHFRVHGSHRNVGIHPLCVVVSPDDRFYYRTEYCLVRPIYRKKGKEDKELVCLLCVSLNKFITQGKHKINMHLNWLQTNKSNAKCYVNVTIWCFLKTGRVQKIICTCSFTF